MEEKDAQPTERTAALRGLSSKIDSRIWVNFTRNGLRLGSRHQEPPHTDVSGNLRSTVASQQEGQWVQVPHQGILPVFTWVPPIEPHNNKNMQNRCSSVLSLTSRTLGLGPRAPQCGCSWHSLGEDARQKLHSTDSPNCMCVCVCVYHSPLCLVKCMWRLKDQL